jgi:hypothetical protein
MSEFACAPAGDEATALAPGHEEGGPRLLREVSIDGVSGVDRGARFKSMAIYKPSPAPSGELQPHRIVVGTAGDSVPIVCSRSGRLLAELEGSDFIQSYVTTHQRSDGSPVILTKGTTGVVCAWDGDDYRLIFENTGVGGSRPAQTLAYNEPERGQLRVVMTVGASASSLQVLDGDTGETLHSLELDEGARCLGAYIWSDDHARRQRVVTVGTRGLVVVIDPEAGGGSEDAGTYQLQRGPGLLRVGRQPACALRGGIL